MGKMIAVCGAPGSGKTTAALKIAEEIYYAKKGSVPPKSSKRMPLLKRCL